LDDISGDSIPLPQSSATTTPQIDTHSLIAQITSQVTCDVVKQLQAGGLISSGQATATVTSQTIDNTQCICSASGIGVRLISLFNDHLSALAFRLAKLGL
jgi:hypothetical protein